MRQGRSVGPGFWLRVSNAVVGASRALYAEVVAQGHEGGNGQASGVAVPAGTALGRLAKCLFKRVEDLAIERRCFKAAVPAQTRYTTGAAGGKDPRAQIPAS